MKDKDTWEIGRYIDTQSWAIMPGDEKSRERGCRCLRQAF